MVVRGLGLVEQGRALDVGGEHGLERGGGAGRRLLRDIADPGGARHLGAALVRLEQAGDDPHQGRLAGAVAPDQPDPAARRQRRGARSRIRRPPRRTVMALRDSMARLPTGARPSLSGGHFARQGTVSVTVRFTGSVPSGASAGLSAWRLRGFVRLGRGGGIGLAGIGWQSACRRLFGRRCARLRARLAGLSAGGSPWAKTGMATRQEARSAGEDLHRGGSRRKGRASEIAPRRGAALRLSGRAAQSRRSQAENAQAE